MSDRQRVDRRARSYFVVMNQFAAPKAALQRYMRALNLCERNNFGRLQVPVAMGRCGQVEYTSFGGGEDIAYDLPRTTSLEKARDAIDRELAADGWHRLSFPDSVFPFVDSRSGADEPVRQWRGTLGRQSKVAEYILEDRKGDVHVWGGIGPPPEETRTVTSTASEPKPPPSTNPSSITTEPGKVTVLCGGQGAAMLAFSNVTNESAQVVWRFRGLDGKEVRGQQIVHEQNGARPNELIVDQAFFSAGPYRVQWSPAEVTMTGTREKPKSVVSATSRVFYPPELRAANVAAAPDKENLAVACR
jgi:hypothetical protein